MLVEGGLMLSLLLLGLHWVKRSTTPMLSKHGLNTLLLVASKTLRSWPMTMITRPPIHSFHFKSSRRQP
ncbi:hypothetical protein P691DRAFT_804398 [Macrolepiota fuliginosa MF-IS2]|uniref:Secreted protein n=1 Tax=Macrolepiota fuliginosa MF-IS2 TaxID=1400762 RepID=A0A9P5X8Y7_9AGAR|nr:hypothetical protein P691DRAFT_804398 [Macrolepiota fuliginosa MF-IS2]